MISACGCYQYTQDETMKEFIRGSVSRVCAFQRENGYLGTYKNERQIFVTEPWNGTEKLGNPVNWTWNIWCTKYTLWGMLEAYQVLADPHILECAGKMADHLIHMLKSMGAWITETGTFFGLPSGSILKPMLILYRLTENRRYLDFAQSIADQWEDEETCCMKIVKMSLQKVPIHHWADTIHKIPVRSTGNPFYPEGEPAVRKEAMNQPETALKVYEMQSCFEGLLELYQITGCSKYLQATINFFDLMIQDEYNTLFSVGYNDLFLNARKVANSISEICDVIHFMRLGCDLFELTKDPKYLDYVELAFYNPFLAGVVRDGSWAARGVRNSEGHLYAKVQAGFTKNHCCTNNMPRGFVRTVTDMVSSNEEGVYINLYSACNAMVHPNENESVHIQISEGYLSSCHVRIEVNAAENKPQTNPNQKIFLRIPSWSLCTQVICNGAAEGNPRPGQYMALPMQAGSTQIEIFFDQRPRILSGKFKTDQYVLTPYMKKRYISGESMIHPEVIRENNAARICVGPVLLAASLDLGSSKRELFDHRPVSTNSDSGEEGLASVRVSENEQNRIIHAANAYYDVTFTWEDGENLTLPMADFASVSDIKEWKDYRYTIFV